MIRLLYACGVVTLVLAGSVLVLCAWQWSQDDRAQARVSGPPGASETVLAAVQAGSRAEQARVAPLVAEASALASHLNPPAPAPTRPVAQQLGKPAPAVPAVRPPAASAKFRLCGTSCWDGQPQRSMALILAPGDQEAARWVKPGTQVGHLLIQEIRPGVVVYRDGDRVQEMTMDREAAATTVAAASRGPAGPASAATAEAGPARLPPPVQRPARSRPMTAGSVRTAALD